MATIVTDEPLPAAPYAHGHELSALYTIRASRDFLHVLTGHDDDLKRSRFCHGTRSRLRLFELGCRQIDFVRLVIDVHRLGANSRSHGLNCLPSSILLLGNAELTFARASEHLIAIPAGSVHAASDGESGNYFAVVCAHDDRLLRFATSDEESVFLWIDRKADWRTARSNRPVGEHFPGFQVNDSDLVLVFQIDIEFPGTIRRQILRFAAEFDRRIYGCRLGISVCF